MLLWCVLISAVLDLAVLLPENCSEVVIVRPAEDDSEAAIIQESYPSLSRVSNITNNTEIWICSGEPITLDNVMVIDDVSNVSILGQNNAIIRCPENTEAGFLLINIHSLTISDITIENCVANSTVDPSPGHNLGASISIQSSSEVFIRDIRIVNGPGTGLAMYNIDGFANIFDSTFEGNGHDRRNGGNGVYMEVSTESEVKSSPLFYTFERCKFINNVADTKRDSKISGFSRFDKGGGIAVFLRSHDGVKVIIENATISGNEASTYGGGVYATFHNDARNSEITVKGSNYSQNKARYGGGHYSGYLHRRSHNHTPLNCSHTFIQNQFTENHAHYGGGMSVFSTKTKISNPNGNVSFDECTWRQNSGHFGSAVAVLPNAWNINTDGYLPTVYFSKCVFDSNSIIDDLDSEGSLVKQYTKGTGALFCTHHTLEFSNNNDFLKNNGSAFYMGTCIARLSEHSKTVFGYNRGYQGGAIHQIASILSLRENIVIVFDSNSAYGTGGAVYHTSYNSHMYDYSRTCLFSYRGYAGISERNITITFINNSAETNTGHSIFAYSLLACYRLFRFSISSITPQIFDQVGNVTYFPPNRDMEIATAASHATTNTMVNDITSLSVLPGEEIQLPYTDSDDLGQDAKTVYLVTVESSHNSSIKVDEAYTYISSNEVLLYGNAYHKATLLFSSYQSRQRSVIVNITMLPCPPGYKLSSNNEQNSTQCTCAYGTSSEYTGIEHCEEETWQAFRKRGYWIGYAENETENEDTLQTGYCPVGFCHHNDDLRLPASANRNELNSIICNNRTGVLCGQCASNLSVYYHNLHYTCKSDRYCEVGWLFYILSELVPVTIIFLIIIIFNVAFTSGSINGFIFFAQVVVMFHVSADDFIPLPTGVKIFNRILHFFYLIFNLNIFTLDEISFCLFRNATALDVIAFSYITLVYAFFLVITVILLVNKLNARCCCRTLRKCARPRWHHTLQGSIIHGLTAFLVLCYAKCAQTSILLVRYAEIHGRGGEMVKSVVLYNGEITWFSVAHLPYAIPAIIMLLVLVILPPVTLLIYPLHYKILTLLNLSESKCINVLLRPLDKLKPLLDSFQGSFKDEYRFFSGLYFIYRFSILTGVTLSRFQEIYFIILGIMLVIILLHATCQPYKNRAHNIIDTLLFVNLAVINGITMYNFSKVESNAHSRKTTALLGYIQSILIGLPFFVVVVCILKKAVIYFKLIFQRKPMRVTEKNKEVEEEELPARMIYTMEELDSSYQLVQ